MNRRDFFKKVVGAFAAATVAPSLPKIAIDIETVPYVWDKTRIDVFARPAYPMLFYGGLRSGKSYAMKRIAHAMNYHMSQHRMFLDQQLFMNFDDHQEHVDAQKRFLEIYAPKSNGSIRGLREVAVDSRGEEDLYFSPERINNRNDERIHKQGKS